MPESKQRKPAPLREWAPGIFDAFDFFEVRVLMRTVAVIVVCAASLQQANAQDEMPEEPPPKLAPVNLPAPVITQHRGTFGGKPVDYQGIVESFPINDRSGRPIADLVATSYIARNSGPPEQRPVLFVFNGGPIVAATPLHMGAFGPKRVAIPDDLSADPASFQVVDNVYAPLDCADVVIFDPASTGFSRVRPGIAPETQFSNKADAWQLTQLVIAWSRVHGREGAPKYLVGESYGTMRAVESAEQLAAEGVRLDGILLLGQAVNIVEYVQRPGNIISYAVSLPTLAAIGWHHNVVARKGRSFERFIRDAQEYAAGEYLHVLFQGDTALLSRRKAVARKLQEFTGLPAENVLAKDLKVAKTAYQRELLPGKILDTSDARYVTAVGEPEAGYMSRYGAAARDHLRTELKAPDVGEYFTGIPTRGGLNAWDWGGNKSPFGDWPYVAQLRGVMSKNPNLRLFVCNGYYDAQTTIGAMDYMVAQGGFPRERVRTRYYQGGHIFYTVERSLKQFMEDVRGMVTRQW